MNPEIVRTVLIETLPWLAPLTRAVSIEVDESASVHTVGGETITLAGADPAVLAMPSARAHAYAVGVLAAGVLWLLREHGSDHDPGAQAVVVNDVDNCGVFLPLGLDYSDVRDELAAGIDYREITPRHHTDLLVSAPGTMSEETRRALAQARGLAAGSGVDSVERFVHHGTVTRKQVFVHTLSEHLFATGRPAVSSYSEPDRYSGIDDPDMIIPGYRAQGYSVSAVVDVSGSMDDETLASALGAVADIAERHNMDTRFTTASNRILAPEKPYVAGVEFVRDRGATDMRVAYDYLHGLGTQIAKVVVTDGKTLWPADTSGVLAIIIGDAEIPSHVPHVRVA